MTTETEVRRWHLTGFGKGGVVIHDETCVGDEALNAALHLLERRPDLRRYTATPESRANRPTVSEVVAAPEPPIQLGVKCAECNLPKAECLRRAAVSGHDFTPPPAPPTRGATP